jgi:hypothetical protein
MKLDDNITLSTNEEKQEYCRSILAKLSRCYWGDIPQYYLSYLLIIELEERLQSTIGKYGWWPDDRTIRRLHMIDNTVFVPMGIT